MAKNPFSDCRDYRKIFIGREPLLRKVLDAIRSRSIWIYGERRVGKTALLAEVLRRLEDAWRVVEIDLMAPRPWDRAVAEIAEKVGASKTDWDSIGRAIADGPTTVIAMDEFDMAVERGLTPDEFARMVQVCVSTKNARLVLVSVRRPSDFLAEEFGIIVPVSECFEPIEVTPFSEEEARQFLSHPWDKDAACFDEQTIRHLIRISGRRPYFLCLVAYHRYEALLDPDYDWWRNYALQLRSLGIEPFE